MQRIIMCLAATVCTVNAMELSQTRDPHPIEACTFYQCPRCTKLFASISTLTSHHTAEHRLQESFYSCPLQCGYMTTLRTNIIDHIHKKHPRTSTTQCTKHTNCTVCSMRFEKDAYHYNRLSVHLRSFECTEAGCVRTFSTANALSFHRKSHNQSDIETQPMPLTQPSIQRDERMVVRNLLNPTNRPIGGLQADLLFHT